MVTDCIPQGDPEHSTAWKLATSNGKICTHMICSCLSVIRGEQVSSSLDTIFTLNINILIKLSSIQPLLSSVIEQLMQSFRRQQHIQINPINCMLV